MIKYYRIGTQCDVKIERYNVLKDTPKQVKLLMEGKEEGMFLYTHHVSKNTINSERGKVFTTFELAKEQIITNIKTEQERTRLKLKQLESYLGNAKKLKEVENERI